MDLENIDLGENYFNGTLPVDFFNSNLVFVNISLNQFSGSIPPLYGDQSRLETVYMFDNMLSGTFPQWLSNVVTLVDLRINNNKLSGSIPNSVENLQNLRYRE